VDFNLLRNRVMKTNTYIFILALILLSLMLDSCAKMKPITGKMYSGFSEIYEGDTAQLKWKFLNAKYVRVEDTPGLFEPIDSFKVTPQNTRKYRLTAFHEKDTLSLFWNVIVKSKELLNTSLVGELKANYLESGYLKGYNKDATPNKVNQIKILNFKKLDNKLTFRILPLDEFGNYIPSVFSINGSNRLLGEVGCSGSSTSDFAQFIGEHINLSFDTLETSIIIENSIANQNNRQIADQLLDYIHYAPSRDYLSITTFNQNIKPVRELKQIEDWKQDDLITLQSQSGLNSLYRSLYITISDIKNQWNNHKKQIIAISQTPDNSSLIYEVYDVVEFAKKNNIPIYIIGIGDGVSSYQLSYLAEATGGKYYFIENNEINKLSDILTEIHLASKLGYDFEFKTYSKFECEEPVFKVTYNQNEAHSGISATYVMSSIENKMLGRFKTVATFDYKDTIVSNEYYENLISLAKILKDNPSFNIELVGHSGMEGDNETAFKLALARSRDVKKLLENMGVASSQLRVRSESNFKPVYFLEQLEWQMQLNRRVELRWLDPALLPYEILAENTWTEEEARSKVAKWEENGYRCYFERSLYNYTPIYSVKLWGYSKLEDAEKDAKELSKKYKTQMIVK